MQAIIDDRRSIYVHRDASVDELPLTGSVTVPDVSHSDPFEPEHMDDPTLYMGDVIVGVSDGEITFVELIVDRIQQGVLVVPLTEGTPRFVPDNIFTARIYQSDEIHVYETVGEKIEKPDVEFDASKLEYPEEELR